MQMNETPNAFLSQFRSTENATSGSGESKELLPVAREAYAEGGGRTTLSSLLKKYPMSQPEVGFNPEGEEMLEPEMMSDSEKKEQEAAYEEDLEGDMTMTSPEQPMSTLVPREATKTAEVNKATIEALTTVSQALAEAQQKIQQILADHSRSSEPTESPEPTV